MSPSISIIVPVYNTEPYLRQCIDSVLEQDFHDWELILIDDGSTDGSASLCDEYADKDSRIKVLKQENSGLSMARNNGISHAKGEYLFFLDSDDEIRRDALSLLFRIVKDSGAKIAAGQHIFTDRYKFDEIGSGRGLKIYDAEKMISNVLYQKRGFDNSVCWKLYKADLFSGYRFSGWFEDLAMFYKLYERAGDIAVSDQIIYFYRKHPASFINSWSEGRFDILAVVDNIVEYVSDRFPSLIKSARHRQFSAYFNVYIGLKHNAPERTVEAGRCLYMIKKLRSGILFDPQSRLKNRIGAIASFFGEKFLIRLVKWVSRY